MSKLIAELGRLYCLAGQPGGNPASGVPIDFVSPDGRVRAMAVRFDRSADWEEVARLYQGVQDDLELPAPAISVSGKSGYQVWFSLAEPVPLVEAESFLKGLRGKYLADLPPAHVGFCPVAGEASLLDAVPALHRETGKWSAFIDPAMGSMFVADSGLEMAPNPDKQADILAGFESMKAGDFRRSLGLLQALVEPGVASPEAVPGRPGATAGPTLQVGGGFSDPRSFLLAVMNDAAAAGELRIEAAKALLPYFEKPRA